ncbi:ribonuclease T2 [uncultured Roseobacter sp.]|uniref:ribonuclease T2 n=1 Tax=uncultured Roseobacter sp. TaxID=114847 RepID=UPI0026029FA8|nr:ribonuclease T2 [uncultured Roseobacter sp.]
MRVVILWFLMAVPGLAQEHRAGAFDYYVLSLSWSPNWCALEGDARGSDQCDARHDHGWILHGLWPQYDRGYPQDCTTTERPPTRAMTARMSDIMGTSGLAWHQWRKHGTCSGLSAQDYFALSRDAYGRVTRPGVLRQVEDTLKLPAAVIEAAFLEANPAISGSGLTITCRQGHIQEARICLTRALEPRACGADVRRDCTLDDALFTPIR